MIGSFDRLGFARHRRSFVAADLDVDLAGKNCLVTGGNAGLGRATAEALARRGAQLWLLCRDAERGAVARAELRQRTGVSQIELEVIDVSDLVSIRQFATRWGERRIDILVHNAGVLPATRQLTAAGLELTLATHVIGPHLLTSLLQPALAAAPSSRVIFVSSGGMYTQRLSLQDLDWKSRAYDGVTAYAQTKRMQVVLAARWAEQLGHHGGVAYSMHPGWADTQSVRTSLPRFHKWLGPLLRSSEEGADTIVWLAVKRPNPEPNGAFFFDRKQRSTHYLPGTRESIAEVNALWALCQRHVD